MTDAVVARAGGEGNAAGAAGNVVCDLDGVLYLADEGVPGAGQALAAIEQRGFRLLFATNNSTRTPAATAAKIARLTGYPAGPNQVVTSAQSAALLLAPTRPPTLRIGGEGVGMALAEAGIPTVDDWTKARALVVGLDVGLTYETLSAAVLAVGEAGARFVATNTDVTFPTPRGLVPGAGAIVAAIAAATGAPPEVTGKPHPPMRALVRERLGPGPTWVVGDRPETDLAMGKAEGWATVLVLTGVVRDAAGSSEQPDHVIGGITDLPGLLASGV